MDTLLTIDGKALGCIEIDRGKITSIAYGLKPVLYEPTISFSMLSPTLCTVDLLGRKKKLNLGNKSGIDDLKAFNQPIEGFQRYERKYQFTINNMKKDLSYFFIMDKPNESVEDQEEIIRWLTVVISNI